MIGVFALLAVFMVKKSGCDEVCGREDVSAIRELRGLISVYLGLEKAQPLKIKPDLKFKGFHSSSTNVMDLTEL